MRIVVLSFIILLLSACDNENKIEYSGARSELHLKADAEIHVRKKLRDPDSAEFSNLRVSSKGAADIVCGEVNSRNGFGGKSGKQKFISNGFNLSFLEEKVVEGGWPELWN